MSDDYVNDKKKEFETEFTETERKNYISYCIAPQDAEKYLSLTHDQLSKMSSQECAIAKYIVSQHLLSIQRNLNRSIAVKNWATRNFEIVVDKEIHYDGTFFRHDTVCNKIADKNSYAKRLRDIITEEQGKIDSLSYICQHIKEIGSSLSSLSYSKKESNV